LPDIARNPAHLDAARYAAFQDFLIKAGIVAHKQPVSDFAVQIAQ